MSVPARIGKYEVLEVIGQGGFATVYKARDPLMKRLVAIKLCSERDEDLRRRFLREAQIAGSLDHPSIVRGFDCGFDEEGVYLVEEYLDGEDLSQKIKARLQLSYRARLLILIEVAHAIGYAHSKGVFHRDLKPGNIRVLESGRVKLMDFGIAKMTSASSGPLTKAGTFLGTAGYVSPETVLGKTVDHRGDIFAFGALAYEFLTYRRPFSGQTVRDRLRSVLEVNPEPVSTFWPDCPSSLESVIFRCLEKDPEKRYQTGADLIADLERVNLVMKEEEEASTRSFVQEPAAAAPAEADLDATLTAPHVAGGAAPLDATVISSAATMVAAKTPAIVADATPPRAPVAQLATEAPSAVEDQAAGRSGEPPHPSTAPGSGDGAGSPAPSAVATRVGRPRLWLLAAAAAVLLGAGVLGLGIWSREGGSRSEPVPDASPSAPDPIAAAPPVEEPAAAISGRLVVSAAPWGELVDVTGSDGELVATPPGSTTPLVLALPPGDYEVRVKRSGGDAEPSSCQATVVAEATARCSIDLARVSGRDYFKESGWWQ